MIGSGTPSNQSKIPRPMDTSSLFFSSGTVRAMAKPCYRRFEASRCKHILTLGFAALLTACASEPPRFLLRRSARFRAER